jgi:hypothetical protein
MLHAHPLRPRKAVCETNDATTLTHSTPLNAVKAALAAFITLAVFPKTLTSIAFQNLYSGFFGSKASASKLFGVMLSITIFSNIWPSSP